jgi:hypothetical protein
VKLVAVLTCLAALGCAGRQRPNELPDDVRTYGEGVRWHKLSQAAAHVPPRERADFLAEREELVDDLRIGDWEIEAIDWTTPLKRATVRIQWTWHLDSRGLVHKTVSEQRWELHGKRWLLIGEVRRRGEPMPGVPEPREKSPEARGVAAPGDSS